jgi:O-antigen/teichoic acid export membrane protein
MSAIKRVISGSIASWLSILIGIFTQIILVPIYLNFWSLHEYSLWLIIQSFSGFFSIIDKSHQNYLGFEFLKYGKFAKKEIGFTLTSGILFSAIIALFQIVIILLLYFSDSLTLIIGKNNTIGDDTSNVFISVILFQVFGWIISGSIGGLLLRSVYPFGYYSRMAWWGTIVALLNNIAPVIIIVLGGHIFFTGLIQAILMIVFSLPIYYEILNILHKENVGFKQFSLLTGFQNYKNSTFLALKDFLEYFRQQGVRLIITSITLSKEVIIFNTTRTGANTALQGLSTITNPLMPELMTFLHERKQDKIEASLGTIWIIVIALMCPGVLILQSFIEPFFIIWTQNKVVFNPGLFATLSLGVLIYGAAQPALAIVTGNNLIKPQILISAIAAIIVIAGMWFLIPKLGILGSGISLLTAEVTSLFLYRNYASKWLISYSLKWPLKQFNLVFLQIIIVTISMFLIIHYSIHKNIILLISISTQTYVFILFFKSLPIIVKDKIYSFLSKKLLISITKRK